MRRIEKILAYDGATELGVGRDEAGGCWVFEGPVIDGEPFRWLQPADGENFAADFFALVEQARRTL